MRYWNSLTALAALAVFGVSDARSALPERYTPSATTVAVVPSVYTGGKFSRDGDRLSAKATETLVAAFTSRGFAIADPSAIGASKLRLNVNLSDEDQQRPETLFRLGEDVKADLVAFVAITDVDARLTGTLFSANREGRATVKAWLVDVRAQEPILNEAVAEATAKKPAVAGVKASGRIREAVVKATEAAIVDGFLSQYDPAAAGGGATERALTGGR